jgi:LysM repeat protein
MTQDRMLKPNPRRVPLVFPTVIILGTTLIAGCTESPLVGKVKGSDWEPAATNVAPAPTTVGAESRPLVPAMAPPAPPTTLRAAETVGPPGLVVATRPDWSPPPANVYTVKKGDTLSGIAREHKVKLEALLAANPEVAKHPNAIAIGQRITLPANP